MTGSSASPDREKEGKKMGWKEKYELVQRTRAQQRETLYFQKLTIERPAETWGSQALVIQRTIAHREIKGNRTWIVSNDCYACSRWRYSIFIA